MRLQTRSLFALLFLLTTPSFSYDSVQLKKSISVPPAAKPAEPTGIAVDARGRFWVTDPANHQLILFSAEGEFLQRVGRRGVGAGEFNEPRGVAVDGAGNAYVADSGNARIQVFGPDAKLLMTFGEKGNEPGQFKKPTSVAMSQDGVLIVADEESSRLQLFSKDGIFLHAFDTGSPVGGLAADATGKLYAAHTKAKQIDVWSAAGQFIRSFGGAEPGMKAFAKPVAIAVNSAGWMYVADNGANHFRELNSVGQTQGTFGRPGTGEGQFKNLQGIAVANEIVYLCDSRNHRVALLALSRTTPLTPVAPVPASRLQVTKGASLPLDVDRLAWNSNGSLHALSLSRGELTTFQLPTGSTTSIDVRKTLGIKSPSGLTTAPSSGALFIADAAADRVVKCDRDGKVLLEFGKSNAFFKSGQGELSKPQGLACSTQGVLFVANSGNGRFDAFNHQGLFVFSGGEKGSGPGQLKNPLSVAWDKERIYVADPGNKKVVTFNTSGRFLHETGAIGPEPIVDPRHVAVDKEGNLFVLDAERGRILAFDPQGVYLGGFGHLGKGDGAIWKPRHFALTDTGDLYLAQEGRIQLFHVVLLPPAPTQLVATSGEGYVSLKWEPVKTRFPARYVVYRSTPMSETQKVKETVDTTAVDDSLVANTTYTYTVVAQSIQGASSVPSAPAFAMAKALATGPRLEITNAQIDDIFSAHYKYYGRVPAGRITLRNNGIAPVAKVKVSFAIQGYMDYPTETAIPELKSQADMDVALPATFNNRILEVTETTPIQAQVKVTYYSGDQEYSVVKNLPFRLYSRNTIRWDKKERFSAFVTPNDPPVIDFARKVAIPFAESHRGAPVPTTVLNAWGVFSGLSTYGISYVPRPNNPYDRASLDSTTVDSLQFARETLSRKSGDCADVVALLASALESMTITTAALDAPGHLFLMFDTGETNAEALGFPEGWAVPYAGTYWIPLEATMLGQPFLTAWKQGAEQYKRWAAQGKVSPIDIHMAWRTFEPATLPDTPLQVTTPTLQEIETKFVADWKALVDLRWQTSVAAAKKGTVGDDASGDTWLKLGLFAVEFKRYAEAREHFVKAKQDSTTAAAALNNLGNLAFVKGDLTEAENLYLQARQKDSEDAMIHINLARLYLKQGHPQKASSSLESALAKDPSLREQFPDVSVLTP